jgi:hypothetical protein
LGRWAGITPAQLQRSTPKLPENGVLGPTGVVLVQEGGWTVRVLTNHMWSYAGAGGRPDMNQTFCSHSSPTQRTMRGPMRWRANPSSTGSMTSGRCRFNFMVAKLMKCGTQPVSIQAGSALGLTIPTRERTTSARGSTSPSSSRRLNRIDY